MMSYGMKGEEYVLVALRPYFLLVDESELYVMGYQ